ncbi:hypothetical protein GCM10009754_30890 [Amycolatopsis minnesotensis]|uniref:Uncharacterized protein n=1 Tax=Amycolatopsis minnesotensis TaxID=337894 RepID=A0ABP5C5Y7_9PSEU
MLLGLGALAGIAFLPPLANHFGYALPGEHGLPFRVHYHGRDYRSHMTCAGADWCEAEKTPADRAKPYCAPREDPAAGSGPLVRVDEVVTLFGAAHPVFTTPNRAQGETVMTILVEASGECYVSYTLMGGP